MRQVAAFGCFALALLLTTNVHAAEPDCIDSSRTKEEFDACWFPIFNSAQDKADLLFAEIKNRYRNNENVQQMISEAEQQWNRYSYTQCTLEAVMARGVNAELDRHSMPVNKALTKCVFRTAKELEAAFSKLP